MNYVEWGKGLSTKQYLQREVCLGSQTACRDGHLRYWSFEEQDSSTGQWVAVSSLESLTRPAFYKIKGRPVQETVSHSVGAVFTPEEYRGKGHAKRLVSAVVAMFDNRDEWPQYKGLSDEALIHSFSALWSDIGRYYEQFGYRPSDTEELAIGVRNDLSVTIDTKDVEWIKADEVPKLSEQDEEQLKAKMDQDTELDGVSRLAICPTKYTHELTHARAHYLAPLLRPEHTTQNGAAVTRFGAKVGKAWAIWTQDFGGNKLNILRMHCDPSLDSTEFLNAANQLFAAAVAEAHSWSLSKVTLWKQDVPRVSDTGLPLSLGSIAAAWNSGQYGKQHLADVHERDGSWPMWRPWQGAFTSEGREMAWVMDGKYAWF